MLLSEARPFGFETRESVSLPGIPSVQLRQKRWSCSPWSKARKTDRPARGGCVAPTGQIARPLRMDLLQAASPDAVGRHAMSERKVTMLFIGLLPRVLADRAELQRLA